MDPKNNPFNISKDRVNFKEKIEYRVYIFTFLTPFFFLLLFRKLFLLTLVKYGNNHKLLILI